MYCIVIDEVVCLLTGTQVLVDNRLIDELLSNS